MPAVPSRPGGFVVDRHLRRLGRDGEVLFGGEPFRLLRLSERGARVLDALLAGPAAPAGPAAAPPAGPLGVAAFTRRLVDGGVLHPTPPERSPVLGEVLVVVPVRDDDLGAARLLERLRKNVASRIVVVDDGSDRVGAARLAASARAAKATLVRRSEPGGPASARNAARPLADTPLVAFVDADVVPELGWLDRLLGHFDDPRVGAVAPRVRAAGEGAIAAYETLASPLDLGPDPGLVGAHRRISYVPSAALVCRSEALAEVGWFDSALKAGEDVDLVRRFERAGWVVRYEPRSIVWHDSRRDVLAFVCQRFAYGTSAAGLERRHPGTVAPFEANWWTVAAVLVPATVAARRRSRASVGCAAVLWAGFAAPPARSLHSKLRSVGVEAPYRHAVAAVLRAQAWSVAGLATALRRTWWPVVLAAAAVARRLRYPVAGALAAAEVSGRLPAWWAARRAPPTVSGSAGPAVSGSPKLATTLVLGALDDLAYGAGVWSGCLGHHSLRAVLPRSPQRAAVSPSSPESRSR